MWLIEVAYRYRNCINILYYYSQSCSKNNRLISFGHSLFSLHFFTHFNHPSARMFCSVVAVVSDRDVYIEEGNIQAWEGCVQAASTTQLVFFYSIPTDQLAI